MLEWLVLAGRMAGPGDQQGKEITVEMNYEFEMVWSALLWRRSNHGNKICISGSSQRYALLAG
jgi:hypothetical protein